MAKAIPHLKVISPADTPFDRAQPLTDHLTELRRRLLWCGLAVAALSALGWRWTPALTAALSRTVGPMVFLSPSEAFLTRCKLAVALGLFFTAPVMLYHAWRFLGVALTVSERRVVGGALPFSYLLFAAGSAFGWFWVAPKGLEFLMGFGSTAIQPAISVASAVRFVLWIAAGLGALFQLPVVIAALAHWGFVRAATLRQYRRHAVILILIVAAVLTPGPDVLSQLLLAAPTYVLFEVSIWLARWLEPSSARNS